MTQRQLIDLLHAVELRFGRERRARNAPRTLDLDIVDMDGRVENPPDVPILPHPRAHERAFVLAPLLDVAPDWVHPALGIPGRSLLEAGDGAGTAFSCAGMAGAARSAGRISIPSCAATWGKSA